MHSSATQSSRRVQVLLRESVPMMRRRLSGPYPTIRRDHGKRKGDRANPHSGDCVGTLCPWCGCCMHCSDAVCGDCPCKDPSCGCS